MNFYQKIFIKFYLSNINTNNILNKTEDELIESAKDTALLYLTINWFIFYSNTASLIGFILPEVEKIMRGNKNLFILWLFLITALPLHYICLTKKCKYRDLVERKYFEGVNWKKNLLWYGLFLLFQFMFCFILLPS